MPSVFTILFHIGSIIQTIKDLEKTVADLLAKKDAGGDVTQLIADIESLFSSGIIPLPPGLSATQVSTTLQSLSTVKLP